MDGYKYYFFKKCWWFWDQCTNHALFWFEMQFLRKGCGMGPLLVLVSYCFRGNVVVVTCKIGSFLCNLDTLLQKNVIVFFFENQISKWRSFEKRAILDLLFTFFSYQGKVAKIPSAHISLTYMYFAHPIDFFIALPILKKIQIYQVWFLCGMIPGVDSYICIRTILEQSINNKGWAKFKLESTTDMYLHFEFQIYSHL